MRALIIGVVCVATIACRATQSNAPATALTSAHNLVIITIDTLRADHVGAYGYKQAHTPTLDTLARGGVQFTHAYATAPITLTSHASLMTGRYPAGHGARHNGVRWISRRRRCRHAWSGRLPDRSFHCGVSARPAVRADQGLSNLRRSHAAKPQRAGGE
jgi:hypothetical protein